MDEISYMYTNYYHQSDRGIKNVNFKNIENKVNEQYSYHQRLEQIGKDRERLEKDVQDTLFEKQRINTYTISELIEKFNLYEEDCFKDINLSDMEEDFVRQGLVAEDYNDYIAYFYPDIMSLADHQLCLDMKLNRKPAYDSAIGNIELFLQELPDTALRYESVWNFHLLDYIVIHSLSWERKLSLIIETLISKESASFLYKYSQYNEKGANAIVGLCVGKDWKRMWEKFFSSKEEEKNVLLALWLRNCKTEYIDEPRQLWLKNNYDFIASAFGTLPKEMQSFVTIKVYYNELTNTNPNMLRLVVDNGCYMPNEHNMPFVVKVKGAKADIAKLSDIEEMDLAVRLRILTPSWYNVNQYYLKCEKAVNGELKEWIEEKINKLCKDGSYKKEEYSELFQSLFELDGLSDTTYDRLCRLCGRPVEVNKAVLNISTSKLKMLIKAGMLEYNFDTLRALHDKDSTSTCEYIFYYKTHLEEMLVSLIVDTLLAEALLVHTGFSVQDYKKIIASLSPKAVTVNKAIANKICALQATQYTVCDENILYDAICLCENEHDAVFAVGHKIIESGNDESVINILISKLPDVYHALSEMGNQLKLKDTDYNRFLVQTLKDADYISSYSTNKEHIIVTTKQED